MSDQLAAAAEAMKVPEAIVERSARAWATATGSTFEDVLAGWAGGTAVATSAPAPAEAPVAAE
ncbi:MAG: rod shape-determining protein MreC, partial [Acidimicrobiia bacterium]